MTNLLDFDRNLTGQKSDVMLRASMTFQGMAHFAGTGPEGRTCRLCAHWSGQQSPSWYAKGGRHGATLKPEPCREYKRLMRGQQGKPVPHDAAACKFFSLADKPPSITAPR